MGVSKTDTTALMLGVDSGKLVKTGDSFSSPELRQVHPSSVKVSIVIMMIASQSYYESCLNLRGSEDARQVWQTWLGVQVRPPPRVHSHLDSDIKTSFLTSVCLSFLISKKRIIMVPTSDGYCKN